MNVRLNRAGPFDEYKLDDDVTLTREFQSVSKTLIKPLLQSEYKGKPLLEVEDTKARKAEVETPEEAPELSDTEGESDA
jgi:hypothetical protein